MAARSIQLWLCFNFSQLKGNFEGLPPNPLAIFNSFLEKITAFFSHISITGTSLLIVIIDGCKPAELSIKLAPKNNQGLRYAASLTMEAKSVKFSFDSVLFDVYTGWQIFG